jgi:hypothetical protein
VALHVKVDVPPKTGVMLEGLIEHVSPAEGDTAAERDIVPVNPLTGASVIADVPVAPAKIVRLLGLVVSVKSWTVTVMVTEWDRPPLVPVTITV